MTTPDDFVQTTIMILKETNAQNYPTGGTAVAIDRTLKVGNIANSVYSNIEGDQTVCLSVYLSKDASTGYAVMQSTTNLIVPYDTFVFSFSRVDSSIYPHYLAPKWLDYGNNFNSPWSGVFFGAKIYND